MIAEGDPTMTVRMAIRSALEQMFGAAYANACQIYKDYDYDGTLRIYGWWYRPNSAQPVFLGRNETEALAALEDIQLLPEEEL